jgi:hypothetical protein
VSMLQIAGSSSLAARGVGGLPGLCLFALLLAENFPQ